MDIEIIVRDRESGREFRWQPGANFVNEYVREPVGGTATLTVHEYRPMSRQDSRGLEGLHHREAIREIASPAIASAGLATVIARMVQLLRVPVVNTAFLFMP